MLSELEIKILTLIWTKKRNLIRLELWLTINWFSGKLKKLKELWYTKIQWYWWSWCTCYLSEGNPYCDCDWSPYVWRFTTISEKWKDYLKEKWIVREEIPLEYIY